jgi:peptide chain release factor 3
MLADPLKAKALHKGLDQLCEEGATQVFRPLVGNEVILGAVGVLQFDVVQARLRDEYRVNSKFEGASIHTVRWIDGPERELQKLIDKSPERLARDHSGALVYLANSRVNLDMTIERWPELRFTATREQSF